MSPGTAQRTKCRSRSQGENHPDDCGVHVYIRHRTSRPRIDPLGNFVIDDLVVLQLNQYRRHCITGGHVTRVQTMSTSRWLLAQIIISPHVINLQSTGHKPECGRAKKSRQGTCICLDLPYAPLIHFLVQYVLLSSLGASYKPGVGNLKQPVLSYHPAPNRHRPHPVCQAASITNKVSK